MTIVVGLTGGIASGKSFVADYLKNLNFPVHDSDKVVKGIYDNPKPSLLNFLNKNGFEKTIKKQIIDKKKISEEIFNKPIKKNIIEKYIHNEVRKSREIFLKKNEKKKIVFLDIPLLFENKLEKICQFVCVTISSLDIRRKRALMRPQMNKDLFLKITKNQTSDKIRRLKSDFIINTNQTKTKTYMQVNNMIYDMLKEM